MTRLPSCVLHLCIGIFNSGSVFPDHPNISHPCSGKVKKCCCCELHWRLGLLLMAIAVILYGIISYLIFSLFFLYQSPSAIYLFVEFPIHAAVAALELLFAEFSGFLLLTGNLLRKPKIILAFSWIIMVGYLIALLFTGALIYEGVYVVDALVYVYYGKQYIKEGEMLTQQQIICRVIYYSYMVLHLLLLVGLTTYVAMLCITYYESMMKREQF